MFPFRGTLVTKDMTVFLGRETIVLGICVFQLGEHTSLEISVPG